MGEALAVGVQIEFCRGSRNAFEGRVERSSGRILGGRIIGILEESRGF